MSFVEIAEQRGVTVVRLGGEIDHSNGDDVGLRLQGALRGAPEGLVVDLSTVEFIDSSAISVLFSLARLAREQDRALALAIPPDSVVERVLGVVALDQVVPVEADIGSALDTVLAAR